MERTPEHIDDIFRKRLHGMAPPPPAFVWDNVERELRKRKRRLLFWIFSIGITGAGILGVWLANTTRNGQELSLLNPQVIHAETLTPKAVTPENTPDNPIKTPEINEAINTEAKGSILIPQSKMTPKGTRERVPAAMEITPLATSPDAPPIFAALQPSAETAPLSIETEPQKTFFEESAASTGPNGYLLPLHQGFPDRTNKTAMAPADLLRKSWPGTLRAHASKPRAKKPVKNCYDFTRQPDVWFLEAYAGPSLAQRELVSNPDDKPYLNKRLSTERRDLAFNAGIRAAVMLKGNFLVRTGVHYDQMTEIFEYIDPEYKRTLVAYVEQPDGSLIIDTVGVEYGEKYQKTFNRFGMLDIPLTAGFELRKGRSGFNINAGMSFNVLFWKRGAILSPDSGTPAWFTPGKPGAQEVFRPRTGINATASVQWFYHVKPRLRVFVEPYFKKILRPVSLRTHPVEQRYGIGGLRLGLTKILN